MWAEGVKREYNDGVTIEERIQRIEHNLDLLAAAQDRLSNINVVLMNSLETRAEWEARMAARVEQAEKDTARHDKNMTRIEATIAEIGDKLNGLIGYVDGMERDDRPPR